MNIVSKIRPRSIRTSLALCSALALQLALSPRAGADESATPRKVQVKLSEWKVSLSSNVVPPGPVVFEVINTGKIPHSLEIEGHGVEKSTPRLKAGASATLALDLTPGKYEAYCPVGAGAHKMMGMIAQLSVGKAAEASTEHHMDHDANYGESDGDEDHENAGPKMMRVVGGGPVIQILPGAFPFADSAMAVIRTRPPDQRADLEKKAHEGPYSNNVATIAGALSLVAIDRGATGDSVSGTAEFTAQDGARWKVVMDRVQTRDIPFNPRFGGVVMGLFYHGASGVHTPLVPTIQSSLALWAYAHVFKNGELVTDSAMVHVMLLSSTRRGKDWKLDCWDCSDRPIEELQLQVTSAPGSPPLSSPGGFLFVNWEKSSGRPEAM